MRDSGYSYSMINKQLGVSKSTLSNWFKDVPFIPNREVLKRIQYGPIKSAEKRHNKRVEETAKLKELGANEIGSLSARDLWLLGIGLYIGEGAKSNESIRIINSDPEVIRLAIKWLKSIAILKTENFRIVIYLYPDNDMEECLNFWQKVTGLPRTTFGKVQIDRRKNKSKFKQKKLPHGTALVVVKSNGNPELGKKLFRRIMGWISGVLSQT